VHTNTTISRGNLPVLDGIVDLVAARGLDRFTMNMVIPCGTAADPSTQLAYGQMEPIVLALRDRAEAHSLRFIWYSPLPLCIFETPAHGLGSPGCAAADGLLHVNPAGDVLPCSSFRHHESLGNILERPFAELWESSSARWFRRKRMAPSACRGCERVEICQGACPLYWRAVGTAELGGAAEQGPPMPPGFEG
jgi:radical SAM protein with 4Fe4S-binding SPASM domain